MHVGQNGGQSELFEGLMGCAIRADGNSSVSTGDLDVQIAVANGGADLVPGAPGSENAIGASNGDEAFTSQASGDAHHVLFGDADTENAFGAFRVPGFEVRDANGAGDVGVQGNDAGIVSSPFEAAAEAHARRGRFSPHC